VLVTYKRRKVLTEEHHDQLFKYIHGIVKNKNSVLYRINGTEDHIHMLCDVHPQISFSYFVSIVKTASNKWMKASGFFPEFEAWATGYGAFTKSMRDKNMIINYIKKQKEHHRKTPFINEYKRLLDEEGIDWDERFLL
jgi:REP element-mobilizing transposase RayT